MNNYQYSLKFFIFSTSCINQDCGYFSKMKINQNKCSKYRFNRLLTKDPSETSSLEYK